ncbi:protein BatD [Salinimonas marina]|uniref:Protein BatD n=1 Tax=Salinimonas marina TaxID=2785918 RepID=A0A7S9DVQ1_9ALTE|nr:BatD family protein [Salinimonas marina]QPG04811.1 protein BatD [Salinimonas marina]
MKQLYILIMGLALSLASHASVTNVRAQIDKNPVMVDEAIRLSVIAAGDPSRDAFDSSALLNDFVVGRTAISNRTSIINGTRSKTTTWTTTLFPRQEGRFTIPAFTIEGHQTQPIEVEVIPVSQSDNDKPARDFYVTTSVDTNEVYLNQQIRYTVKLFLATDIERGSLQAPKLAQAQISQLGDDRRTTEIVNGRRYQVIERNFAVVPQRSGEFTIQGPVFTGEVLAPNTNQRFGFFNRTQTINRLGPDITLTVKAQPDDIDFHWLPSEFVDIHEEWPQQQEFTVGEPVTRTMTLTAMGVVEEQLPDFPTHYPPGFKVYPDQSQTATVDKDNTLIAQRVASVAIIPTKAGKYVLPEITIPWFNVLTQETEYATLKARSIEVVPDTASAPAPTSPAAAASSTPEPETGEAPAQTTPPESGAGMPGYAMWLLLGLWVATVLLLAIVIRYYRKKLSQQPPAAAVGSGHERQVEAQAYAQLESALKSGQASQVVAALHHWLRQLEGLEQPLTRPADSVLTAPLQAPLDALLASLYGPGSTTWDVQPLRSALVAVRQQYLQHQQEQRQPLSPLYQQ